MENLSNNRINHVQGILVWKGRAYSLTLSPFMLVMNTVEFASSHLDLAEEWAADSRQQGEDAEPFERAVAQIRQWLTTYDVRMSAVPPLLARQSLAPVLVNHGNWSIFIERLIEVGLANQIASADADVEHACFLLDADGAEKRLYGTKAIRVPLRFTGHVADGILVTPEVLKLKCQETWKRVQTSKASPRVIRWPRRER